MKIFGGLDDQIILLIWSKLSHKPFVLSESHLLKCQGYGAIFQGLMHPFDTTRPLHELMVSFLLSLGNVRTFNVILFVVLLLNFVLSFSYFKKYKFGLIYSLIFSLSSYMWVHLVHLSLLSIWLIPLFMSLYERLWGKFEVRKILIMGLYISLAVLFSNYLGFFVLVLFVVLTLSRILAERIFLKEFKISHVENLAGTLLISFVAVVLILSPYLQSTYLSSKERSVQFGLDRKMTRTYEDFFYFSSRPWYFFLPSVKNPVFGMYSQRIYDRIEETNYFLADDYQWSEHSANYFGLALLIFSVYVFILVFLKGNNNAKTDLASLLITLAVLVSVMMPPYFTVSGVKIFTPGFLVYRLFPMFRSTVRLSIIVLFCLLVSLAKGVEYICANGLLNLKLLRTVLIFVAVFTLVETYVPVDVLELNEPSQVYKYINDNTDLTAVIAVYPYQETREALYWIDIHRRCLINIRGLRTSSFNSETFTHNISSEEGRLDLVAAGVDYLVVMKYPESQKLAADLDADPNFSLVIELEDSYLYEIK